MKTRCECFKERFSNNRVIVRSLSWLVCIGPFQPPNKGDSHYWDPGNPFSTFSFFSKQGAGGTPTSEIRKSFLHVWFFLHLEPIRYSRALDQLQSRDLLDQRVRMRVFLGPTTLFYEWQVGNLFGWSEAPGPRLTQSSYVWDLFDDRTHCCLVIGPWWDLEMWPQICGKWWQ